MHSLRRSLLSPSVLALAALEAVKHPRATGRIITLLLRSRGVSVMARNVLVLAKGLWLAGVAGRWRADHIHAHWGRTTATAALIASELSGIPWSLTLHRNDIAKPNLLTLKMHKAAFTRFISRSGMDMARDVGVFGPLIGCASFTWASISLSCLPLEPTTERSSLFFCPAHLYPVKGHRYLIEALRILKDRGLACSLLIAGRGHLWRPCRSKSPLCNLRTGSRSSARSLMNVYWSGITTVRSTQLCSPVSILGNMSTRVFPSL